MIRNRRWGGLHFGVNTLVWSLSLSYSRYGSYSVSACLGPLWVSYAWGRE